MTLTIKKRGATDMNQASMIATQRTGHEPHVTGTNVPRHTRHDSKHQIGNQQNKQGYNIKRLINSAQGLPFPYFTGTKGPKLT
jgi:hypothetical protein